MDLLQLKGNSSTNFIHIADINRGIDFDQPTTTETALRIIACISQSSLISQKTYTKAGTSLLEPRTEEVGLDVWYKG